MLSGIQHYIFCKRQWALIHIEKQWAENLRTVEGNILHEKAHDSTLTQKRGDIIISRGLAVRSENMGISGECDVVEFTLDNRNGVNIFGREGLYSVCPIEYKRGSPKENKSDIVQLTAQAMCLEEMLCTQIEIGYIFYGETKRRQKVLFTDDIRQFVLDSFKEMHEMFERKHTPKVKTTKGCNACSLKEICLPILNKNRSAKSYIDLYMREDI